MTEAEKTERLAIMSDLCSLVLDANRSNIIDQFTAKSHMDLYLGEIKVVLSEDIIG